MVGLFLELMVWTIRIAIVICVLFVKAVVWAYRETDRIVHAHRLAKDPGAGREASQAIAGSLVAGALGVLVLIGSATGGPGGSGGSAATPLEPASAVAATSSGSQSTSPRARTASVHHIKLVRERRATARAAAHRRAVRRAEAAREARAARARARAARARAAAAAPSCNPNYGGCLEPDAYDYDCSGGSGDGPEYTGQVTVKGDDVYDLDRDGDGVACDT